MSAMPPMPPSADEMFASMRCEGFYESTAKMYEQRIARLARELHDTKEALRLANERAEEREQELSAWVGIAYLYGIHVDVQKRRREHDLHGEIVITSELVMMTGAEAIDHACARLARRLRALLPAEEAYWNGLAVDSQPEKRPL